MTTDPASLFRLGTIIPSPVNTASSGLVNTPVNYAATTPAGTSTNADPFGSIKYSPITPPGPGQSYVYNNIQPLQSSATPDLLDNVPVITNPAVPSSSVKRDTRVRVSLPALANMFYQTAQKGELLYPLALTDGVIFPFQPKVDIVYKANYEATSPAHSNFTFQSYKNSAISGITISGDFPVRTPYEGLYVIACLTFLRSLTMMFTAQDVTTSGGMIAGGTPPQVARLWGMGFGGLDCMPIAITSVTTSFPEDVNYVTIDVPAAAGGQMESTKIPVMMTISIDTVPLFSRAFASKFSAFAFANGSQRLLGGG